MKAVVINEFGGPEVFQVVDVKKPEPEAGEVLIKVEASSVNPVDTKIRSGLLGGISPAFPAILHGDCSGIVEKVGEGVEVFAEGDAVYCCPGGFKHLPGCLAEYVVADVQLVAKRPKNVTSTEAAVLPLASITAWDALFDRGCVEGGMKVLVHAGCGGVGHIGMQLAKAVGAEVTTTVSNHEKAEVARNLGADHVALYKEQEVADYVNEFTGGTGYDVVFDTVGGECLQNSFKAMKMNGMVVSIAARSEQDLTPLHTMGGTLSVTFMLLPLVTGVGRGRHGDILRELTKWVEAGEVKPLLDPDVFKIENVGAAHAKLEAGKALGKISLEW